MSRRPRRCRKCGEEYVWDSRKDGSTPTECGKCNEPVRTVKRAAKILREMGEAPRVFTGLDVRFDNGHWFPPVRSPRAG